MARDGAGVESLYPFLYSGGSDLDDVLDQVRRSTVDKAAEIVELRRLTVRRDAARLADCARAMARSFAGGGRLFAMGNGGSAADAQHMRHGARKAEIGSRCHEHQVVRPRRDRGHESEGGQGQKGLGGKHDAILRDDKRNVRA